MSLNDNHMLPDRVRNMRQMKDVLTAEDIILKEVERIIDEMYQRASLLHEELINELWMKTKLEERTHAVATINADAEKLLAMIILNVSEVHSVDMEDVRKFINKWLPAHLMYKVMFLLESNFLIQENVFMIEMALEFKFPFWRVRTLDGSWLLDGNCNLDAVRQPAEYGFLIRLEKTEIQEDHQVNLGMNILTMLQGETLRDGFLLKESCFWKLRPQIYEIHYECGTLDNTEKIETGVILRKDLWHLNGDVILNGKRLLDAEKWEEKL